MRFLLHAVRVAFAVLAGLPFLAGSAHAGEIKIIANSSVATDSVSPRELKSIFLKEKNSLDSIHVEPVLQSGGPAHELFLKRYLGSSDDELQRYFGSLVFTGKGSMPKILRSDVEVVECVAKTRGAIGYVSADSRTEGVKVLSVGPVESGVRRLLTRVEPDYPEELLKRQIGGTVRLKITIAPSGAVEHAELLGGNPVLGDAAIAAIQKWKYSAAASRSVVEVSVPFIPR